jgi:hypothetical protein
MHNFPIWTAYLLVKGIALVLGSIFITTYNGAPVPAHELETLRTVGLLSWAAIVLIFPLEVLQMKK